VPKQPLAVNVVVCQEVLTEATNLISAIRIFDTLTIAIGNDFAHFYVLTTAFSNPGDLDPHTLKVTMNRWSGEHVASAPEYGFTYGYNLDSASPGGFRLTTEFNVDLRPLGGVLGSFMIWIFLDGAQVAKAPITLRRR
jgi:hypothetical protein